uniref:Uncharacterized protein n=1 Tax=Plectus sambesii TaxID=2011161 RepID=A0A914V6Z6_9BILA
MSSLPGGDEISSRRGSFAPNDPAAGGQPVQLRFDQFDTAIRDPSKQRGQGIAQAQRRPVQQPTTFSRDWWTKPKIV